MASERKEHAIFEEDEVSIIEGGIFKCGLVRESAEYISSEDEEDDESNAIFEKVTAGTVRVVWHPDGTEEVIQESKLTLEDRSLVPGDVVCRLMEDEDSQRGYVTNSHLVCHVQVLGTDYAIKDVDSKDLQLLQSWEIDPGDVYLDSWVGKIDGVTEILHVSLPDGTSFKVDSQDGLGIFVDANEKRTMDSEFYDGIFYEGQYVKASQKDLSRLVKKDHPKYRWPKKGNVEYICKIEKIEVKRIYVHWLCHGCDGDENFDALKSPPPSKLKKEQIARLKSLDCFASSSIELGDKAKYTVKPDDAVLTVDDTAPLLHSIMQKSHDGHTVDEKNEKNLLHSSPVNGDCVGDVSSTDDGDSAGDESPQSDITFKVDRQKSSRDTNHKSKSVTCESGDQKDFGSRSHEDSALTSTDSDDEEKEREPLLGAASQKVSGYGKTKGKPLFLRGIHCKIDEPANEIYGSVKPIPLPQPGDSVPVEVIYTRSYIDVIWQDGTTEKNILSSLLYPVHHLDELEFFPGDYVIPATGEANPASYGVVVSVQHCERTCMVQWINNRSAENIQPEEVSVYDIKDHPEYRFRPGHIVLRVGGYDTNTSERGAVAGQVYELGTDGRIFIQWADGKQSHCYPQDIYLIDSEFSELNESLDDSTCEEDESDDSWVTEEETEVDAEDPDVIKNASSVLVIEASQKVILDQMMDKALSGLHHLEESFNQAIINQQPESVTDILEELLHIHQQCRLLDKTLKTSYFRDRKLILAIRGVKTILNRERENRMVKKARELFHANTGRMIPSAGDSTEVAAAKQTPIKGTDLEKSPEDSNQSSLGLEQLSGNSPVTGDSDSSDEDSDHPASEDVEILALLQEFLDMDLETKELLASIRQKTSKDCSEDSEDTDSDEEQSGDVISWWIKYLHETSFPPGLLVSRMVCRCLQALLGKVLTDLSDKWEELRKSGKLKVLGDDDDDDDIRGDPVGDDIDVGDSVDQEANLSREDSSLNEGSSVDPAGFSSDVGNSKQSSNRAQLELQLKPQSHGNAAAVFQSPLTPQTPADIRAKLDFNREGFTVEEEAPTSHRFYSSENERRNLVTFSAAVKKEMKMLETGLPRGIYVKGFSDRMDLYSVMMLGPTNTPYEDGLFFFDLHLPNDYPFTPPHVHYVSFCSDKLNPNLYVDGKVCVSLLGTWIGKGSEVWTSNSSLLQLLISIQGLVLVSEPYFNEAGYDKQKGTQHGLENSRMYNEMVLLKVIESMTALCAKVPEVFRNEASNHIKTHAPRLIHRLEYWLDKALEPEKEQGSSGAKLDPSQNQTGTSSQKEEFSMPDFPLFPLSRGFQITLKKLLSQYKKTLSEQGYNDISS